MPRERAPPKILRRAGMAVLELSISVPVDDEKETFSALTATVLDIGEPGGPRT